MKRIVIIVATITLILGNVMYGAPSYFGIADASDTMAFLSSTSDEMNDIADIDDTEKESAPSDALQDGDDTNTNNNDSEPNEVLDDDNHVEELIEDTPHMEGEVSSFNLIDDEQIVARADDIEFLSLESVIGEKQIPGAVKDADAEISNANVATYKNGKIYALKEGNTVIKIPMEDGSTKTYNTSVFYKYPQPKTSTTTKETNLCKWGKWNNTDVIRSIPTGTKVTILYRTRDSQEGGSSAMQYVKLPNGDRGYMSSADNNDLAADTYNKDVKVGDIVTGSIKQGTHSVETATLSSSDESIAKVDRTTIDGVAGQAKITGVSEGATKVTYRLNSDTKTSVFVNVYTPIEPYEVKVSEDTVTRISANSEGRYAEKVSEGTTLTINGSCGEYYRYGASRYILKSKVKVDAIDILLNNADILLYDRKYNNIEYNKFKINAVKVPETATGDIEFSSSDSNIVTVSQDGIMIAKKEGDAVITVGLQDIQKVYRLRLHQQSLHTRNLIHSRDILRRNIALRRHR